MSALSVVRWTDFITPHARRCTIRMTSASQVDGDHNRERILAPEPGSSGSTPVILPVRVGPSAAPVLLSTDTGAAVRNPTRASERSGSARGRGPFRASIHYLRLRLASRFFTAHYPLSRSAYSLSKRTVTSPCSGTGL